MSTKPRKITEEEAKNAIFEEAKKIDKSNFSKVLKYKDKIINKAKSSNSLKEFLGEFYDLFAMLKDYAGGKYKKIPFWMIASIAGTLIYVLNPMDMVPDAIPFVGLLDDTAVFSTCLSMIGLELKKYREWKNKQKIHDK